MEHKLEMLFALKPSLVAAGALFCATTVVFQHAGATTSSYTSSFKSLCYEKTQACQEDTVCADCAMLDGSTSALLTPDFYAFYDCYDPDDSLDTCEVRNHIACCMDSLSAYDCFENDLFVDRELCYGNVDLADNDEEGRCTTLTSASCGSVGSNGGGSSSVDDSSDGGYNSEGTSEGADGTSGVARSSQSTMLKLFVGLASFSAAPILAVLPLL